jgi:hypothetical protein
MTTWPYLGVTLAALSLAWLFRAPRPSDPAWLFRLLFPVYAIHQFEEYGIDLTGAHYAFPAALCASLGYPSMDRCPATPEFCLAVNAGSVWIASALAWYYASRRPLIAACAVGIPLGNVFAHVGPALVHRAYNPGLGTALALFTVYVLWTLRCAVVTGAIARRQLLVVVASGVAVHVVLASSVILAGKGFLSQPTLWAIQIANAFLPAAIALVGERLVPRAASPSLAA